MEKGYEDDNYKVVDEWKEKESEKEIKKESGESNESSSKDKSRISSDTRSSRYDHRTKENRRSEESLRRKTRSPDRRRSPPRRPPVRRRRTPTPPQARKTRPSFLDEITQQYPEINNDLMRNNMNQMPFNNGHMQYNNPMQFNGQMQGAPFYQNMVPQMHPQNFMQPQPFPGQFGPMMNNYGQPYSVINPMNPFGSSMINQGMNPMINEAAPVLINPPAPVPAPEPPIIQISEKIMKEPRSKPAIVFEPTKKSKTNEIQDAKKKVS